MPCVLLSTLDMADLLFADKLYSIFIDRWDIDPRTFGVTRDILCRPSVTRGISAQIQCIYELYSVGTVTELGE